MQTQYLVVVGQPGALRQSALKAFDAKIGDVSWLAPETAAVVEVQTSDSNPLKSSLEASEFDWCLNHTAPTPAKLFLADMDSTMITVECIDELADYAGLKEDVSAVTEAAMRGELDFEAALTQRVALLEGLNVDVLEDCYREKVTYTQGARTAVQTMASGGAHCALVSGGFTFFTQRVAETLGFHEHRANILGSKEGTLTGLVTPPLSNAQTKLDTLQHHVKRLGLNAAESLAVGDGANDIPMLQAAGLGVAYRAKPKTKAAVDCAIDHSDLTTLLYFQGIPKDRHAA